VKKLFTYIQAILVIIILSSCIRPNQDDGTIDILTLKGPSAMSMLYLIDQLKELDGIQVRHEILNEPMQIRARMLREEPEMALLPTNMAANLFNKGVPYLVAAIPVWGTLELFGKDSTIKNWDDLRGKRVHIMAKGMTPDILFRFLAKENNLDPDEDIILDYSFPTHSDLANAVIAGLADIAVLSEPLVTMVRRENKKVKVLLNLEKEWNKVFSAELALPQTSLVVKSSFATENPDLIISYIKKYQEYCSKVVNNPTAAAPLAVSYNILPDEQTAAQSIPGCNMRVVPSWQAKDRINEYLQVFYNFDPESIGGKMPDETFFFKK